VSYGLILDLPASQAVATLDDVPHELFVLACLDLTSDPYSHGAVYERRGAVTTLTRDLGGMGLIVYDVDEEVRVVTVKQIILL
jgi:hypothetical protein